MLPKVPDTVHQFIIVLGLGAFIAATVQPTAYYEQWEDADAEATRQSMILDVEQNYVADVEERILSRDPEVRDLESLILRKKELQIQAAEAQWATTRASDLRDRC